jgi:putative endonuclease
VLQRSQNNAFGQKGEDIAIELLTQNGYRIIDRNFHSRFGEIDIVAIKDSTLIFDEVKIRHIRKFGMPEEAVTKSKLWKIRKTGEYYSLLHSDLPKKLRIDVVALIIEDNQTTYSKIINVS